MHSSIRRALGAAAIVAAVAAGCGDDDDTVAETATEAATEAPTEAATEAAAAPEAATGDVLEVAAARSDVTTFLAALEASGIMNDFHGEGPFTLFIPTDQAFADYVTASGMEQTEIFADPALLTMVLQNHVVAANDPAEVVMEMAGQAFTSAAGNELDVTVEGETVMINDATVLEYDLTASNGVIHIIDTVLVP
jgi:uncharacterized surface protein with fasciclin (FAS1) repeats